MIIEYLLIAAFLLIPFLLALIHRLIMLRKIGGEGTIGVNILASYGIYTIALIISSFSAPLEHHVMRNCSMGEEGDLPCSLWVYKLNDFLNDYLLIGILGLAVIAQVYYLIFVGSKITFNKHRKLDAEKDAAPLL